MYEVGQARKSLWIETFPNALNDDSISVRLVRACGSKLWQSVHNMSVSYGQARKSLWIETFILSSI